MKTTDRKHVHVAVGVVSDTQGRVLIARRPDHLHQGGLWEFPGGKVHTGETVEQALVRELEEEIGITPTSHERLIQIGHDYGDKQVWLDVFSVRTYTGRAQGKEGQPLKWISHDEFVDYDFPVADRGILNAIKLPRHYMITGECDSLDNYIAQIERAIVCGVRLVQFRARHLGTEAYLDTANGLIERFQNTQLQIILNTQPEVLSQTRVAGLHLTSAELFKHQTRPVANDKLLGASVHNEGELLHALQLNTDFIVISPIRPTRSHPQAVPIGWSGLEVLVQQANCPVYALGGLTHVDLARSLACGAQGIAGISMFQS